MKVRFEKISNISERLTAVNVEKLDVQPFGVIPPAMFMEQGANTVLFGGGTSEGSEIAVRLENAGSIKSLDDFKGKKSDVAAWRLGM